MKKTFIGMALVAALAVAGCSNKGAVSSDAAYKPEVTVEKGRGSPEVKCSLCRLGE